VTAADDATPVVAIGKSTKEAPAGTVTLGGVDATAAAELESETTRPPAAVESQTRPVAGRPPLTTVGATVTDTRVAARGVTVRRPLCEPAKDADAVIFRFVVATTGYVVTGKVALGAPAGMVTLAGNVAADSIPLESVTSVPPAGARPLRATVPVEGFPPATVLGLSDTETIKVGLTERTAVRVERPLVAVIVAVANVVAPTVVIMNVAVVAPSVTVTVAGTLTSALEELRDSGYPPVGAGPLSVTVPMDVFPPGTLVGETERLETIGG
jgi:hypothetical protein